MADFRFSDAGQNRYTARGRFCPVPVAEVARLRSRNDVIRTLASSATGQSSTAGGINATSISPPVESPPGPPRAARPPLRGPELQSGQNGLKNRASFGSLRTSAANRAAVWYTARGRVCSVPVAEVARLRSRNGVIRTLASSATGQIQPRVVSLHSPESPLGIRVLANAATTRQDPIKGGAAVEVPASYGWPQENLLIGHVGDLLLLRPL